MFDEEDLQDIFQILSKHRLIESDFPYPKTIKKFRNPELPDCAKQNK